MQKKFDVVILGAGTAGLAALKEVKRHTKSVLMIDPGPLGTTCARVGCMPSKVFIQVAHDVHRARLLEKKGIMPENGRVQLSRVMEDVRRYRDYFVEPIVRDIKASSEHFLQGHARFTGPQSLSVDGKHQLEAKSIIIATGSRPVIPASWPRNHPKIVTTDDFFEWKSLPQKWAVVGLGPIGLELGQALAHLGLDVHGYDRNKTLGGLAGSQLNEQAYDIFQRDMKINRGDDVTIRDQGEQLEINFGNKVQRVDAVLAAMGRQPNLDDLDLEQTGCEKGEDGLPIRDEATLSFRGLSIYLAGDVDKTNPLLHEASDEGRIAGYNASHEVPIPMARRTPLAVVFTHPGIAAVGKREAESGRTIIGKASYDDQGRAKIMGENQGAVHLHVAAPEGQLLGADILAPGAEHLAHLLALAVDRQLTVSEMLELPFYHPTLEEGIRTALRDAARQL
ncbi:MAG TPA: dihydrolipoyl dehydrogenase [Oligoflexus sp.]|uniref:dihydrolipoyl dehydrogenase n=1 Tax=Oligoflexus sp. TaxID=1971216 RepID=UPI002D7F4EE9|nr:dihydrolipoyl dehydrogenase [Oligoflexus sp.]HET9238386.1 dihydrolipoyl dehydrogenase [Oligoflexus sp.]